MAVNLFRHKPFKFITIIKDLQRLMPKDFKSDSKLINDVTKKLAAMKPMNLIQFSAQARAACKKNNDEINKAIGDKDWGMFNEFMSTRLCFDCHIFGK